jgi:hypothetical protein
MPIRVIETYRGQADLVLVDGRRYPVTCSFSVWIDRGEARGDWTARHLLEALRAWRGSFAAQQEVQAEIFDAQTARLELPDGRFGDVRVIDDLGAFTGTGTPPGV